MGKYSVTRLMTRLLCQSDSREERQVTIEATALDQEDTKFENLGKFRKRKSRNCGQLFPSSLTRCT